MPPRVPITRDAELFRRGVELGCRLIHLHTCGDRFSTEDNRGTVPRGQARITKGIPDTFEGYPESFSYSDETKTLHVGEGELRPVEPEVMRYSVSGFEVVHSWLSYRMKEPIGRSSSPLDEIRPDNWTRQMTEELLELLWILEATIEQEKELANLLNTIIESQLVTAGELPEPTDEERKAPEQASDDHGSIRLEL